MKNQVVTVEQAAKFRNELQTLKSSPAGKEHWGDMTTAARVLNVLAELGVRVNVHTQYHIDDETQDGFSGSIETFFSLPDELALVAVSEGLRKTFCCKRRESSKVMSDKAKQFHLFTSEEDGRYAGL
jgi:hypothetical protein